MQSVLRVLSVAVVIGVSLIAAACRNEAGLNERATTNQNSAANNSTQTNDNQNRATDSTNANLSSEQEGNSSEDFEGTAGVTEKKKTNIDPVLLRTVRTAQHEKFDRVVFEFSGRELPGYHIEYVDRPARQCGSGEVVRVAGAGWLLVRFTPANAHTESGEPTIKDTEIRADLPNLKELKSICDFEADVSWVLGLAHPNRYRVLELSNPARLVIDVKH